MRRGRRFVPVEGFQIIADELFIETGRALSNHILVFRPETRRIRRKTFVNQQQLPVERTDFDFSVGDNDAAFTRVFPTGGDTRSCRYFRRDPGRPWLRA